MDDTLSEPIFAVRAGAVIGRDHAVKRRNCQDAFAHGQVGESAFGIVCDGCGEGARSELGANLSAAIAREAIRRGLEERIELASIPEVVSRALNDALLTLLGSAAEPGPERGRFVRDHLLATVVAFVVTPEEAITFAFGDGLILADDEVIVLSEDNQPRYPAYALLGRSLSPSVRRFGRVERIGVATDGLDPEGLRAIVRSRPSDVRRTMRVLQHQGALEDDGAIVIATRSTVIAPRPSHVEVQSTDASPQLEEA